jgi:hypothetical protein
MEKDGHLDRNGNEQQSADKPSAQDQKQDRTNKGDADL